MTMANLSLSDIAARAAAHHLEILGGFHPGDEPGLPPGSQTVLLLGPAEPGFWPHLTAQPEWGDGRPDPIDRWSRRVIGGLACDLGGKARFPFGGPPWHPFYQWALRSGRSFASPVRLLVHDQQGLFFSVRGALVLRQHVALPEGAPSPCDGCAAPCLQACPARALGTDGYDVPRCHAYLDTPAGAPCLTGGCLVRRACPISQSYARLPVQSAYHMGQFHK